MRTAKNRRTEGLRAVSAIEAAKGVLVLIAGFGILTFLHGHLHHVAEQIVRHMHLNPASRYPMIFIDAATRLNGRLWLIALSALLYSAARFIEAFGLWHEREWAEWFGVLTGGIYIPVELFEVIRRTTWLVAVLLVVNAGIVAFLARVLYVTRRAGPGKKRA
ncbi:MAG: DUF2127 domain-containing protein [Nitrospiraceae bacterium]|nr:DUF2127 domain-containing protein [Nitrospiraceae bacterium]